jgi:hypothetical protein
MSARSSSRSRKSAVKRRREQQQGTIVAPEALADDVAPQTGSPTDTPGTQEASPGSFSTRLTNVYSPDEQARIEHALKVCDELEKRPALTRQQWIEDVGPVLVIVEARCFDITGAKKKTEFAFRQEMGKQLKDTGLDRIPYRHRQPLLNIMHNRELVERFLKIHKNPENLTTPKGIWNAFDQFRQHPSISLFDYDGDDDSDESNDDDDAPRCWNCNSIRLTKGKPIKCKVCHQEQTASAQEKHASEVRKWLSEYEREQADHSGQGDTADPEPPDPPKPNKGETATPPTPAKATPPTPAKVTPPTPAKVTPPTPPKDQPPAKDQPEPPKPPDPISKRVEAADSIVRTLDEDHEPQEVAYILANALTQVLNEIGDDALTKIVRERLSRSFGWQATAVKSDCTVD